MIKNISCLFSDLLRKTSIERPKVTKFIFQYWKSFKFFWKQFPLIRCIIDQEKNYYFWLILINLIPKVLFSKKVPIFFRLCQKFWQWHGNKSRSIFDPWTKLHFCGMPKLKFKSWTDPKQKVMLWSLYPQTLHNINVIKKAQCSGDFFLQSSLMKTCWKIGARDLQEDRIHQMEARQQ